jgi:endo-alpha-1,4-polygalactosaminidase (GH114 family)
MNRRRRRSAVFFILVFSTVDYALDPENVAWVYETSRELGFMPFVGNRALDRYVEPMP